MAESAAPASIRSASPRAMWPAALHFSVKRTGYIPRRSRKGRMEPHGAHGAARGAWSRMGRMEPHGVYGDCMGLHMCSKKMISSFVQCERQYYLPVIYMASSCVVQSDNPIPPISL